MDLWLILNISTNSVSVSLIIIMDFVGQCVIITGSGNGLGKVYAIDFALRGAKVLVNDINQSNADKVVQIIRNLNGLAFPNYNSVEES